MAAAERAAAQAAAMHAEESEALRRRLEAREAIGLRASVGWEGRHAGCRVSLVVAKDDVSARRLALAQRGRAEAVAELEQAEERHEAERAVLQADAAAAQAAWEVERMAIEAAAAAQLAEVVTAAQRAAEAAEARWQREREARLEGERERALLQEKAAVADRAAARAAEEAEAQLAPERAALSRRAKELEAQVLCCMLSPSFVLSRPEPTAPSIATRRASRRP